MTTFNEKSAASAKNPAAIRPPHELRKFQDLRILDIAAGLYHILLFAVSKSSPSNSLDITSSDPNENIPIRTWTESDTSANELLESQQQKRPPIETKHQTIIPDFKNIISPRPVLAKETLQAIQLDVQTEINRSAAAASPQNETKATTVHVQPAQFQTTIEQNKIAKLGEPVNETVKSVELAAPSLKSIIVLEEPSQSQIQNDQLVVNDKDDTMDAVTKSVSNIGDSLMTDIKSIATAGEEKLNDLAKETEKTIKEVPKNVIDYVKTSAGLAKGHEDVDDENVLKMDEVKESAAAKAMPKELTDPSSPPMQQITDLTTTTATSPSMLSESDQVKHNNKLNRALAADDSNETILDDAINNEVKFINNGVDVSGTSNNIIQAMHDEINEMGNEAKNKADELTMKYDGIINDELNTAKDTVSTKIFEVKNGNLFIQRS